MFYYHLERQVISSRVANPLDFRALELIESSPDDIHYLGTLMRDPEKEVVNFRPNEEAHIYHSKARFGLSIKNHGGHPYYIYIFYFDPSKWYVVLLKYADTEDPHR
jgi:hypothetical protein